MRNIASELVILFWIFCFGPGAGSKALPATELRGVSPSDENYYKGLLSLSSSATIKCKDGSKKITRSQLNDDFCDCPDASDEPGTSACPHGKFYCRNTGDVPLILYSSRVNDGICDCCDGSDEHDGKIKCPNSCWEAGKVAREKLQKKIGIYQEGVTIRKQEVEKAMLSIAKDEAELQKLKSEEKILKGLVQQLKDQKMQIEKAEEKERLQREKEEKERKEAEEASQKEKASNDSTETLTGKDTKDDLNDRGVVLEDSPSAQDTIEKHDDHVDQGSEAKHPDSNSSDGDSKSVEKSAEDDSLEHVSKQEEPAVRDKDIATKRQDVVAAENTDSLSREELGRLVASRWTGEKSEQEIEDVKTPEGTEPEKHEHTFKDEHEEEYEGYDSEDIENKYEDDDVDGDANTEDPIEGYDDQDHGDLSSDDGSESYDEPDLSGSKLSWLEKIQAAARSIFQAINLFQSPIDKSEAARIRKEYDESSSKLSKLQSKISSLTQKLKHDFGPEKEFFLFYGKCFESKQNKYVYKICPYKQATQEEGHSTTSLGNWDKFEDSYLAMKFSSGDKCWNGPDRSLKVKLRCGLNDQVTDVDEPSRCEYVALLSTPALCVEEKLKELQEKLDILNKQQPSGHDEL